jgi:hypothetical protein
MENLDDFDAAITDADRSDLADLDYLPEYVENFLGPAGEAAVARADDMGLDFVAAGFVGQAVNAAARGESEEHFRSEMMSLRDPRLIFEVARDLLAHDGLWPWEARD